MKTIDFATDAATLARAMGADLAVFNTGVYEGTGIRLRQMPGHEQVIIRGTTAGASVITDETWITDRFGRLGARQIKALIALSANHLKEVSCG